MEFGADGAARSGDENDYARLRRPNLIASSHLRAAGVDTER